MAGQSRTRLADGRWLIIGGEGAASAALWDPLTQTTTPTTGTPIAARAWHTATLLSDGTVLLAGGTNGRGLVDTAEIFEPASGTFRQIAIAGAATRASHSATLLSDGTVLLIGGTAGNPNSASVERWDVGAQTATRVESVPIDRTGHTATLASDGTVEIAGGRRADGRPGSETLVIDPNTGAVTRRVPDGSRRPPSSFAASSPSAGAEEVPVDAHVTLRFSDALDLSTITSDAVTLVGPDGPAAIAIVPAEDGRLVFAWPGAPLANGAAYELRAAGLVDALGRTVAPATIRFTTRQSGAEAANAIDSEAWAPDAARGEQGWRTNRPPSPWESLAPLMAPTGVTAVSGRVLRLDGRPLPDVTLEIAGREARTDRTGRFLIQLESSASRMATLEIDARTASTPHRTYGVYEALVPVHGGRTNVLPFTIWSPLIDTAHQVTIASPTTSETVITTPAIPGLELHLPAGTVIRDEAHQIARTVSITPVPLDRTPFPLPENATFSMFFTIQPGGAYLSTPGPIKGGWLVYPNVRHSRTGSRVQFFTYDPDDKGWYPYGMGTITGETVVPDAKTRLYGFTGASFNDATPTPPNGRPPGTCRCEEDGDPVNLATGIFSYEMTDLVVPDVMPIVLSRAYNSQDPYNRAFGTGMSHSFGLFQHSESWPTQVDFYLPDGGKVHFDRISDPALNNNDTVFAHTATPTGFFQARMRRWENSLLDAGWQVVRPDGTTYIFPHSGSPLLAIRDRHDNEIRLTWESGLLRRVTSPNGRWIAFTYGTGGRVSQVSDNIGRTVSYTYDANGNLLTVTDPEQHVTSYGWTATNQMASVKPRNLYGTPANLVTNEYTTAADAPTPVGWIKTQTHADGGVYQFAYTVSNGKSTQTDVTDPLGHVRRATFNSAGYLLSDTRAFGLPEAQTTTSDRPGAGNFVTTSTDTLNGQPVRTVTVRDALGNVVSVTRCLAGQDPCTDTSPNALTTHYTYDPRFQQIATVTDPLNHTTTYAYDNVGNLTSVTDALQHATTFEYNGQGQITSTTDALQHTTRFDYIGGDLVATTDPLMRVTRSFTDSGGRLLSVTDPLGQTTRYTYDRNNQVISINDALGSNTAFVYFPDGQVQTVTDANQHTTNYTYDAMGRMASRTDPLQRAETFSYDLHGNPHVWIDRKGQITTRSYDSLDRLHQIEFNDASTVTYTYDERARVRQLDDSASNASIVRTYDDFDQLMSEATPEGSIAYTYDAAGRRATMTVQGGPLVTYTYDNADRLTGVIRAGVGASIDHDDANRRTTLTLPNGVTTDYTYDDANQLTDIIYRLGSDTLGTLDYHYDLAGRRVDVGGTWARTGLPQAVSAATYDAANQLTAWEGQTRRYDANGNLVSDGLTSHTWDARQHLAAINSPLSAGFSYDATGRRTLTTLGGVTTQYTYDGVNAVTQVRAGTTTAYLSGDGLDDWFARIDSSSVQSYLTDALGSTVATIDPAGNRVAQFTYDPFGSTGVQGSATDPIRFAGREQDGNGDEGSGLYYLRSRYYSSVSGRFIGEDPIGFAGHDVNLYSYVFESPINNTDPLGLQVSQCTRPLNGLPTLLNVPHIFIYTPKSKGVGFGPAGRFQFPGLPDAGRIEREDPYDPQGKLRPGYSCSAVSTNKCVEQCVDDELRKAIANPPPIYKVGPRSMGGYQCNDFVDSVLRTCRTRCGGKS